MGVCFGLDTKSSNFKTDPSIIVKNDSNKEKIKMKNKGLKTIRLKCIQKSINTKHNSDEIFKNKLFKLKNKCLSKTLENSVLTLCEDIKPVKFLDVNKYISMIETIDLNKKKNVEVSSM